MLSHVVGATRRSSRAPFWPAQILSVSRAAAETLWIRAADAQSLSGPIVLGAKTGIVEEDALGDFLVSTVRVTADKLTGGYAQYAVKIPKTATYYISARLRYPHGIDESFAVIPGSEKPTTDMSRCLGMSGVGVDKWHWDSQGRSASRPAADG